MGRTIPSSKTSGRARADAGETPLPMVEVAIDGVDAHDWVTETIRAHRTDVRLIACRPSDRGRRRLLRLFDLRSDPGELSRTLRSLRARLDGRDLAVTSLGPDRALVRVSVPLPRPCASAFDLGDFCLSCPFLGSNEAAQAEPWSVLVPEIADARRLLDATGDRRRHATLLRAGAYRLRGTLTARQERALRTAFALGYFDYPRRATLGRVASELGVGRSSALELLRKATSVLAAQRFRAEPVLDPGI